MTKSLDYKKVLVGVSGGVDSSVCIDLLKKQGLEVEGVVIRFSPESDEAVKDAQKVCDKLGITLHIADAQADFKKYVVAPFCENYVSGKTPNPCIVCNPHVKFATLIKTADELGIGYIATGHYAQVEKVGETYFVKKAVSVAKDQSYMLYRLPQEILSRLILPIGSYEKPEIREMAGELELFNADKPDSQEICFIPDNDDKAFLKQILPPKAFKKGKVFHADGRLLGNHDGIQNYTVGQRKGLGIALGKPAYVVALDAKKNSVILGDSEHLMHNQLTASQNNYFIELPLETPIAVDAKIRYRAQAAPAELLCHSDGTATVTFKESQRAITPGQCVAYYKGDALIGGGIIETAQNV